MKYNRLGITGAPRALRRCMRYTFLFLLTIAALSYHSFGQALEARFTADKASGGPTLTVSFTDQSINPDVWLWEFGDGGTSGAKNPTYTYTRGGVFSVKLTIIDTITGASSVSPILEIRVINYAYDVSKAVYAGIAESFSIGAQEPYATGLTFNPAGTKMFIAGDEGFIIEYNLSVAFDVSTAVYAGDAERFDTKPWETFPLIARFNPTGSKMFVLGYVKDDIFEYNLSVPFDVSTATHVRTMDVGAQTIFPVCMTFNPDGSKMFVLTNLDKIIFEYSLSTNFNISTASFTQSLSVNQGTLPGGFEFTPDGREMFITGWTDREIRSYTLSTPFDISTAVFNGNADNLSVSAIDIFATSMAFNTDGTKMHVLGREHDRVYEFDLVNFAPTIGGTVGGQAVSDNTLINPFSMVTISDPNRDEVSATITLDNNAKGVLSGAGLTGTGPYTISSTSPGAIRNTLRVLQFNPTDERVAVGLTETTTFTLEISDGLLSDSDNTTTVISTSVNDEPTLTSTGQDPVFIEDGAAVNLFNGTAVNTLEAGQAIASLTFSITNVSGSEEILNVDGTPIQLTDGNSGTTATNSLAFNVSVVANIATVTLTGGSLTTTATQTLVNNLTFESTSNDPNTASRVLTIEAIQDDGGTANGGDDTSNPSFTSTVSIISVNDTPVFTLGTDQNAEVNTGAQTVAGFATGIDDGEDNTTQILTFNIFNDNNSLFSVQPDIDESTGDLTFTPATNQLGTATVTVSLSDDGGTANGGVDQSANQTFTITISDTTPPVITCPTDKPVSFDASCQFVLPDYTSEAVATDGLGSVTVTQGPLPGVTITSNTTITLTAVDGSGNSTHCTFDVIPSDNTDPVITCPGDQQVDFDANCQFALPDYTGLASASDNCNVPTVSQSPAAGTIITGTQTITLTADDGNGNTAQCTFDVIPSDNTDPVITCPGDQQVDFDANCQFALPDYTGLASVSDNCSSPTISQSPTAGTIITATQTITLTAEDGSGNTAQCTFDVIPSDNTDPVITCPGDQQVDFETSCQFSLPDYTGLASVSDNCSSPTISQSPAAGTIITATQTITLTAEDGSGNTAQCTFDVIPSDNTDPVITCPGNQQVDLDANCQFTIPDYTGLASASDNCSSPTVSQSPAAGTIITATQTITLTAEDGSGNTTQCTFDVIVKDVMPPIISCAGNVESCDEIITFSEPTYSDNCSGAAIAQTAGLPSGSAFPVGTTTNTYVVTDGSGNTAICSFDIVRYAIPTVDAGPDVTLDPGFPHVIDASVDQAVTYEWYPVAGLDDPLVEDPTALPFSTTNYILTVTNSDGCISSDDITVTVEGDIEINNFMSPNGDGKNDTWEVKGNWLLEGCRVHVFNSWGNTVFESTGYQNQWDGTRNGQPVPKGNYNYIISCDGQKSRSGNIVLIR